MEIGDKVFVYKEGEGFASGEILEFGPGIITDIREYKSINNIRNIFQIKMMNGETVYACYRPHMSFEDCFYYFITKDEYDDMINRKIKAIDSRIERLFDEKESLFNSIIDWDKVKLV